MWLGEECSSGQPSTAAAQTVELMQRAQLLHLLLIRRQSVDMQRREAVDSHERCKGDVASGRTVDAQRELFQLLQTRDRVNHSLQCRQTGEVAHVE